MAVLGSPILSLALMMAGILLVLGTIAVVWMRVWLFIIAGMVRVADHVGLISPSEAGPRRDVDAAPERVFILISRALRWFTRALPIDSDRPVSMILALLLVGLPIGATIFVAMWVVPVLLVAYVFGMLSGPFTAPIAVLSAFVYVSIIVYAYSQVRSRVLVPSQPPSSTGTQ